MAAGAGRAGAGKCSIAGVLDVSFDEDAARNRADNGPENLATLRRLTPRTARLKLGVAR